MHFNFLWRSKKIHSALTPAPALNSLPNKFNGMRRGVQVSFEERNPTRDAGTVQSVCGLSINIEWCNVHFNFLWRSKKIHSALTLAPAPLLPQLHKEVLPKLATAIQIYIMVYAKSNMRRGVQVSFWERDPTRDTGTV